MFTDKRYQEICGIVLILLGVILFLSLVSFRVSDYGMLGSESPVGNIVGPLGAGISHGLRSVLGISSYFIVGIIFFVAWVTLRTGNPASTIERVFSLFFLSVTTASFAGFVSPAVPQLSGGYAGCGIAYFLTELVGSVGAVMIILILNIMALILLGVFSMTSFIELIKTKQFDAIKGRYIAEKFTNVSGFIKRIRPSFILKGDADIPLNTINEDLKSKKQRKPWITKETIWVDERGLRMSHAYDSPTAPAVPIALPIIADSRAFSHADIELFADNQSGITSGYALGEINEPVAATAVADPEIIFEEQVVSDEIETQEAYIFDEPEEAAEPSFETIRKSAFTFVDIEEQEELKVVGPRILGIEEDNDNEFAASQEIEPDEINENSSLVSRNLLLEKQSAKDERVGKNKDEEIPREKIDMANPVKRVFSEIPINKSYIIPTNFLRSTAPLDAESWKSEIRKNSELLVNTLAEFGIESSVAAVNRGPVITLYELHIAPGIKVNRIVGLSDDIAMALAASRVRVVAPIPGKSAVGVEIPNTLREDVTLGDIVKTADYKTRTGFLKVALGKDILGKPLTLDLKRLPHLLIAGATGSGKSVCVNTIITSLIYNYDPNYVRFILVDPKMVELQLYNGMPHLLTPVITEPQMTPAVLKWAIYEMERRYRLLSSINTRDIERYNEKVHERHSGEEKLPYIVIIIDELADLMMVASKEVEGYITRLAQKARAIGIHLVLATQRPSVDVITGIIKANFPARIAFQVAQKTDSRTIIDQNGAEKLLGQGDMLYQSPMSSYPVRIQGAFISEDEIANIVEHLERYGEPAYIDIEQALFDASEDLRESDENEDELFVDALKIVEETRKASASYLQRRLSIGYNRAARIIELMEDRGYIGPQQGSKPREVFV